jgi:CHAT domain
MPPVVTLAACHTDVPGEAGMASFAAELVERGPVAVIATEASITDVYATRFFARTYNQLASSPAPDVLAAVSEARRAVQRELERSPEARDQQLALLDEWATVSVLCAGPVCLEVDPTAGAAPSRAGYEMAIGEVHALAAGEV